MLTRWLVIASFCGLALAGCGGGGSSGSSTPKADFLIHDAPSDQLLSFSAVVTDLRLASAGGLSANLLDTSASLELLGLQTTSAWLQRAHPAAGTYTAVQVTFDPLSISAKDKSGADVAVTVQGNVLTADFVTPLVVTDAGYSQVVIDLDLQNSLSGDVNSPPLIFDPQGSSSGDDGSQGEAVDSLKGAVVSADANTQSFVMTAKADDDFGGTIGNVAVTVDNSTLLFGDNDSTLTIQQFFAALTAGTTIEVHGQLVSGAVLADRVEIDDDGGHHGGESVKIEGLVSNIGGSSFDLLIVDVKKGSSIVDPILNGLGNPAAITVSFDNSTKFLLDSHTSGDSSLLVDGGKVTVKFSAFATQPFPASQVELDEAPQFEGAITDISGAPDTFIIHLDPGEPAIANGSVASSSTDVTVDVSLATIELEVTGKPTLTGAQLLTELEVEAEGVISGNPNAPTITAAKFKVHPGRFNGGVSSISVGNSSFVASVSNQHESFGSTVVNSPYSVLIDANASFTGDAATKAQFFALFQGLSGGQTLTVEVRGIGTGNADEVTAYEIDSKVQ